MQKYFDDIRSDGHDDDDDDDDDNNNNNNNNNNTDKAVPLQLDRPRGFQEVKAPRFRDNGTGWW